MRLRRFPTFVMIFGLMIGSLLLFLYANKPKRDLGNYRRKFKIANSAYSRRTTVRPLQAIPTTTTTTTPHRTVASNLTSSLDHQIPVLVIAATRPEAIKNHLSQLIRIRPTADAFPIIVSQDGNNTDVTKTVIDFAQKVPNVHFIQHEHSIMAKGKSNAYFRIAQHYKFALSKVFDEMGYKVAVITEDDLDLADDFFSYFSALRTLLYDDPTIWCISAWNDNGNPSLVNWENGSNKLWQVKIYSFISGFRRTDFFPGLGWMLTVDTWRELTTKWPDAYWDDWLRQPDVRKDRVCIRPEQSRTLHNFSVAGKGSSNALYKGFLSSIRLPAKRVDFAQLDLAFLRKEPFDDWLGNELANSEEIPLDELIGQSADGHLIEALDKGKGFRVTYKDPREFRQLANKFNFMSDIRSGMARTAYYGVVPIFHNGVQLFVVHHSLDLKNIRTFVERNSSSIYSMEWDKKSKFLDFAEIYCTPKRWTGKCDPYDPEMREWFHKKGWIKRLEGWLPMTVF